MRYLQSSSVLGCVTWHSYKVLRMVSCVHGCPLPWGAHPFLPLWEPGKSDWQLHVLGNPELPLEGTSVLRHNSLPWGNRTAWLPVGGDSRSASRSAVPRGTGWRSPLHQGSGPPAPQPETGLSLLGRQPLPAWPSVPSAGCDCPSSSTLLPLPFFLPRPLSLSGTVCLSQFLTCAPLCVSESVCVSLCLPPNLSCLCVCVRLCLSLCVYVCVSLSVSLCVWAVRECVSVSLLSVSFCGCQSLSVCMPACLLLLVPVLFSLCSCFSLCRPLSPSACLSLHIFIAVHVSKQVFLSGHLSLQLSLCVSGHACLSLSLRLLCLPLGMHFLLPHSASLSVLPSSFPPHALCKPYPHWKHFSWPHSDGIVGDWSCSWGIRHSSRCGSGKKKNCPTQNFDSFLPSHCKSLL